MQANENVTQYGFMQQERPVLGAKLSSAEYPELEGTVYVYFLPIGIYIQGNFYGLPHSIELAFHIHEGTECGNCGKMILPLPDIIADREGNASIQVFLGHGTCTEIAGKTIVLHLRSGGGETEAACGVLERIL